LIAQFSIEAIIKALGKEHIPRRFLSVLFIGDSIFKSEEVGRIGINRVMLKQALIP